MALDIGNLAGRGTLAQYIYDNVWKNQQRRGSGRDMEGMTIEEADLWKPQTITAEINGQTYTVVAKRDERELFDSTPLQILSVTVDGKTYGPEEYDELLNQKYELAADGNVITRALTGQDEPDSTPRPAVATRSAASARPATTDEPRPFVRIKSPFAKVVNPEDTRVTPAPGTPAPGTPTPGTPTPGPAPAGQGKLQIERDASGNFVNLRILDASGNPAKFANGTDISMATEFVDEFFDAFAQYQITKDDIANTFSQMGMSAIELQNLSMVYAVQNRASMNMTVIEGLGDAIRKIIASQKFTFLADTSGIIGVVDQSAAPVPGVAINAMAFNIFDPDDQANAATKAIVGFFDQIGALDIRGAQIAKLLNDVDPSDPSNPADRALWLAELKKAYEDAHTAAGTTPDADVMAALNATAVAPAPTPQARAQLIVTEVSNNAYAQANGVTANFDSSTDFLTITVDGKSLPFDITEVQRATGDTLKDLLNANPSSFVDLAKVITGQTDPTKWTNPQKLEAGTAILKLGHTAGLSAAELDALLDKIVPAGQPNPLKDAVIAARTAGLAPAPAVPGGPASPLIPGDPEWLKNLEKFASENRELAVGAAVVGTTAAYVGTRMAVNGVRGVRSYLGSEAREARAVAREERAAARAGDVQKASREAAVRSAETRATRLEGVARAHQTRLESHQTWAARWNRVISQSARIEAREAKALAETSTSAARAGRAAATALAAGADDAAAKAAAQVEVNRAADRSLIQRVTDFRGTAAAARKTAAEEAVENVIKHSNAAAAAAERQALRATTMLGRGASFLGRAAGLVFGTTRLGRIGRFAGVVGAGYLLSAGMGLTDEAFDPDQARLNQARELFGADSPAFREYETIYAEWKQAKDTAGTLGWLSMGIGLAGESAAEGTARAKLERLFHDNNVPDEMRQVLSPLIHTPLTLEGTLAEWAMTEISEDRAEVPPELHALYDARVTLNAAVEAYKTAEENYADSLEGFGGDRTKVPADIQTAFTDALTAMINAEDAVKQQFETLKTNPAAMDKVLSMVPEYILAEYLAQDVALRGPQSLGMFQEPLRGQLAKLIELAPADSNKTMRDLTAAGEGYDVKMAIAKGPESLKAAVVMLLQNGSPAAAASVALQSEFVASASPAAATALPEIKASEATLVINRQAPAVSPVGEGDGTQATNAYLRAWEENPAQMAALVTKTIHDLMLTMDPQTLAAYQEALRSAGYRDVWDAIRPEGEMAAVETAANEEINLPEANAGGPEVTSVASIVRPTSTI